MWDKIALKILVILIVLLMLVSCATPSFAVDNPSANNTLNQFGDIFPSGNITAMPFSSSSNTYYVPGDFAKIQWAVDNASAGDTIVVRG